MDSEDLSNVYLQSWPFHLPVSSKKIPDYHKIIKSPMDLQTMKKVRKALEGIPPSCILLFLIEMLVPSLPEQRQLHD